jgi:hypothetical protein
MKNPQSTINHRIQKSESLIRKYTQKLRKQSIFRLSYFFLFLSVFVVYAFFADAPIYFLLPALPLFALFYRSVRIYNHYESYIQKLKLYNRLLVTESNRINFCLEAIYQGEPDYSQFVEPNHFYKDLDIQGRLGLFTYLDTTVTKKGEGLFLKNLLLLENQTASEILERQSLIRSLSQEGFTTLQFLRYAFELRGSKSLHKISFASFHRNRKLFFPTFALKKFFKLYVVFGWVITLLLTLFDLPALTGLFLTSLFFIHLFITKKVVKDLKLYEELQGSVSSLKKLILLIYSKKEKSSLLSKYFTTSSKKEIITCMDQLNDVLQRSSIYQTPAIHFMLNTLFLWDLWQASSLEKWNEKYKNKLDNWSDAIFFADSIFPFVTLSWENPTYTFPKIDETLETISAAQISHPLIQQDQRVFNPLDETKAGEIQIITGSNMSGKTTYLRSVGVNVVLALCGSSVCAVGLQLPVLTLFSSIQNLDSLQSGISFFYSEVKRISYILKTIQNNPDKKYIVLLDEVLKGTNTRERFIASQSIIQKLCDLKCYTLITTHDLDLTKNKKKNRKYMHFSECITDNKMTFDYTIRPGVVTSSNALKILEIEGIEI